MSLVKINFYAARNLMNNEAQIYGIKNCDTVKKCLKWMDEKSVSYHFHDYKKQPPEKQLIEQAIELHGWDNVLNKRGTTWRQLPETVKQKTNNCSALKLALDNPSIIKRPLLLYNDKIHLGFKVEQYEAIFKK